MASSPLVAASQASSATPTTGVSGTAGVLSNIGTAAETEQDRSEQVMRALDPYYDYRKRARERQAQTIKDIYAAQERALKEQRVGLTKGERLMETLAAFGQPVSGGIGEALANAARVTVERDEKQREADRLRKEKLAELALAQQLKLAEQQGSYDKEEMDYLAAIQKKTGRKLTAAGTTKIEGRDVPLLVDTEKGEYFVATPGGEISPVAAPGGAAAPSTAGLASAAPASPPAAGGAPAMAPGLSPVTGEGDRWKKYVGKVVKGSEIGAPMPDAYYSPTTNGIGEPLKQSEQLSGDAALRASLGAYDRGYMTSEGFKPVNEQERRPTLVEYRANLSALQSGLAREQEKLNQLKRLRAQISPLTTGIVGAGMKYLPETKARELRGAIQTAVSNIALDRLGELKRQSSTGASGLGSTTQTEIDMLKSSIAELGQDLSDEALKRAVDKVIEHYGNTLRSMTSDGRDVAREFVRVRNILEPPSAKKESSGYHYDAQGRRIKNK